MNYVEAATAIEPAPFEPAVETGKPFDIATHNGYITITSKESGVHRTFRIHTQKVDAKFAPGERLVGLLIGSDNEHDYKDFAFIGNNGRVILWKKHRGDKFYEWAAKALENPQDWLAKCDISFDGRCRKCNRLLTDPTSVELGIGPKCRGDE